jgi:hypothetical protein
MSTGSDKVKFKFCLPISDANLNIPFLGLQTRHAAKKTLDEVLVFSLQCLV